eukprot:TCALIF_05970-PA protein Name:"Similar to setd7 Histone-lysine N-methyltransferase SETD7 (Halocynthia roretzi)" AED:0.01 eAED:0.01 QI:153/1/0.8/1/1/1/5/0/491
MKIWWTVCQFFGVLFWTSESRGESCRSSGTVFSEALTVQKEETCHKITHRASNSFPDELRLWINDMESSAIDPLGIKDMPSDDPLSTSCFSEDDVEAIFAKSGDNKTSKLEMKPLTNLQDLHGAGRIVFKNGTRLESSYFQSGWVRNGFPAMMYSTDKTTFFLGNMVRGGCFHGLVRGFNVNTGFVSLILSFDNGTPNGPMWNVQRSKIDNYLVGLLYQGEAKFSAQTPPLDFTGKRISFVYPDFNTTIQGSFKKGVMLLTQEVIMKGLSTTKTGLKVLQTSEPFGVPYKRDVSTGTFLSSDPLLRDPFESKMVTVGTSSIPNAGDGVFTLQDIPKGTVIAYFNGIRLKEKHIFNPMRIFTKKSVYLVEIGEYDDFLDIPAQYSNWTTYQATAGHKVNHGKKDNCKYSECQHPRFGTVLCLAVNKDVKAGSELFTLYNVSFDKQGMKSLLKTALSIGHLVSGKDKKTFVKGVKPYLHMASKWAELIKIDDL